MFVFVNSTTSGEDPVVFTKHFLNADGKYKTTRTPNTSVDICHLFIPSPSSVWESLKAVDDEDIVEFINVEDEDIVEDVEDIIEDELSETD